MGRRNIDLVRGLFTHRSGGAGAGQGTDVPGDPSPQGSSGQQDVPSSQNDPHVQDGCSAAAGRALLLRLGANETTHSSYRGYRRSLYVHLTGTYDLLKDSGYPESVCLGGLMHSIYGTNVFKHQTLDRDNIDDVDMVIRAVGNRAEELAWWFCTLDRPRVLLQRDQQAKALRALGGDVSKLNYLIAIEIANLIEQGGVAAMARWF